MLVIRNRQFAALATERLAEFERRMAAHLRECFPEWSRLLDPEQLSSFVRNGIRQAQTYGFRTELELARYLHVMKSLGEDFDRSPDHAWAADLLTRQIPSLQKMKRLQDAADYQLEARRISSGR